MSPETEWTKRTELTEIAVRLWIDPLAPILHIPGTLCILCILSNLMAIGLSLTENADSVTENLIIRGIHHRHLQYIVTIEMTVIWQCGAERTR